MKTVILELQKEAKKVSKCIEENKMLFGLPLFKEEDLKDIELTIDFFKGGKKHKSRGQAQRFLNNYVLQNGFKAKKLAVTKAQKDKAQKVTDEFLKAINKIV